MLDASTPHAWTLSDPRAPVSLFETASGRQREDDVAKRTQPPDTAAPVARARKADPADDRLNERMQAALRHGAETREDRDHTRSIEDGLSFRREAAALKALIDANHNPVKR